ncbi:PseudoU-synth-1 domain-containing protein [Mycena indigotica]|uniref:tRNA pseudouridine synthase 1 n=1 Tax=Mycena indigotica TaxID=2126181 RepID=A0A8H6SZ73_9AGAR|nr:PseudoU-synth-1 domain-containing protein [Mycena indigotica]KAF7307477.1 PseudoU-synth-1 domain-containing protein [Mycena indigotica]
MTTSEVPSFNQLHALLRVLLAPTSLRSFRHQSSLFVDALSLMDSEPSPTAKRPNEDQRGSPDPKRAKTTQEPDNGEGKSRKGQKQAKGQTSKKMGRRKREQFDEKEGGGAKRVDSDEPKAPRLPKRMCALLIGFCGSGYSGMQIQRNAKTIENTLFDALVRIGAVSKDNADDPVKVGLGRAARTDAGVHAAGNVVALKMITQIPGVDDLAARINEELPPEIRLWGHIRVQNSFNPRTLCDSRKYTYFFPSYLLIPPKPTSALYRVLVKHAASLTPPMDVPFAGNEFWSQIFPVTELENMDDDRDIPITPNQDEVADMARKRAWRIGSDQMERLRAGARRYLATHNFHNFTVNGAFGDRSNQRVMKNIEIADPVVYGETEWISVLFHGQSFMMHQIVRRKMISALVLTCRTGTPPELIDELYGPRDVFIPKMPALGLLLEQPIFDSYNTRVAKANEKVKEDDPDHRPPIKFDRHRPEMEAFKEQWIYKNMRTVEERDGLFDAWIRMVDAYGGSDLLYLNPRGTIPAAAVIQLPSLAEGKAKGKERHRKGGFREKKLFDATSFPVGGVVAEEVDDEEDPDEAALLTGKREELDG